MCALSVMCDLLVTECGLPFAVVLSTLEVSVVSKLRPLPLPL